MPPSVSASPRPASGASASGAALLGCLLGLAFMLPGHIFGATGAGDVKLLAAAGALLGPTDTIYAFLYTAIAGGVLALLVAVAPPPPDARRSARPAA